MGKTAGANAKTRLVRVCPSCGSTDILRDKADFINYAFGAGAPQYICQNCKAGMAPVEVDAAHKPPTSKSAGSPKIFEALQIAPPDELLFVASLVVLVVPLTVYAYEGTLSEALSGLLILSLLGLGISLIWGQPKLAWGYPKK